MLLKRRMVEQNMRNLREVDEEPADADDGRRDQRMLAALILGRMLAAARDKGVPLVIQSIPVYLHDPPQLVDRFPLEFDVGLDGIDFLSAKQVLEPHLGEQPLYWLRSHRHWTPFSHRQSGRALAKRIDERGLLE